LIRPATTPTTARTLKAPEALMIGEDHDPDKNPHIKAIMESMKAEMQHDDDEIEKIEQQLQEAKKKLEDGNKWPDQ
jgi:hypothetical protein